MENSPRNFSVDSNNHNFFQYYERFSSKLQKKLLSEYNPNDPFSYELFGAVLFADISGFTRLSLRLTAEELKYHINKYFTQMMYIVDKYHGDVIKFCGDAIMIVWPLQSTATTPTRSACIQIATKCAKTLLQVCGEYEEGLGDRAVHLRLHCGIGSGQLYCMCLGDNDRRESLVSGEALWRACRAANQATLGQLCVSEECVPYVSIHYFCQPTDDDISLVIFTKEALTPDKRSMTSTKSRSFADDSLESTSLSLSSKHMSRMISRITDTRENYAIQHEHSIILQVTNQSRLSLQTLANIVRFMTRTKKVSPVSQVINVLPLWEQEISQLKKNSFAAEVFDFMVEPLDEASFPKKQSGKLTKKQSMTKRLLSHGSVSKFLDSRTSDMSMSLVEPMRLYLPQPARTAVETETLNDLSEIRQVVTIFIDVLGLRDDFNDGLYSRPQKVIAIVLRCLREFGGTLRQFVVDDKGCVVILAFGLSNSSYEDNSFRAIELSMMIRRSLNSIRIDTKIGITSGKVFCGLVGSVDRCEYAMVGASVNLAARLMGKAGTNSIIVSEDIATSCVNDFEFIKLAKIKAKGYSRPITAYTPRRNPLRLTQLDSLQNSPSFFVGREKEIELIRNSYIHFSESSPKFIEDETKYFFVLQGGTGIGKTVLLGELQRRVFIRSGNSVRVAVGSLLHISNPYYCIKQIFLQIFPKSLAIESGEYVQQYSGDDDDIYNSKFKDFSQGSLHSEEQVLKWVELHLAGQALVLPNKRKELDQMVTVSFLDLVPLLNDILPVQFETNNVIKAYDDHMKKWLLHQLLVKMFQVEMSVVGSVVLLDNLQWIDQVSLDILLTIVSSDIPRMFVVAAIRDQHSDKGNGGSIVRQPTIENFGASRTKYLKSLLKKCNVHHLEGFGVSETQQLLQHTLGDRLLSRHQSLLSESSVKDILSRTSGSPYFLIALATTLRDSLNNGQFAGISSLPSGDSGIIMNRFDALDRIEQKVLKTAAVIGIQFGTCFLDLVLQAMATETSTSKIDNVHILLSNLAKTNIIQFSVSLDNEDLDDPHFEFVDDAIRQCIYNLMLSDQKQALHNTIARLMQEKHCSAESLSAENVIAIADHIVLSNNRKEIFRFLNFAVHFIEKSNNHLSKVVNYLEVLIKEITGNDVNGLLTLCTSQSEGVSKRGFALFESSSVNKWLKPPDFIRLFSSNLSLDLLSRSTREHDATSCSLDLTASIKLPETELQLRQTLCSWLLKLSDLKYSCGQFQSSNNIGILALYNGRHMFQRGFQLCRFIHNVEGDDYRLNLMNASVSLSIVMLVKGQCESAQKLVTFVNSQLHSGAVKGQLASRMTWEMKGLQLIISRSESERQQLKFLLSKMETLSPIVHSCVAIDELSVGHFKFARNRLRHARRGFLDHGPESSLMLCQILHCWISVMSGRMQDLESLEKNVDSLLESAMLGRKQFHVHGMMRLVTEVRAMARYLAGNQEEAIRLLESIKAIQRKDDHNATTCALLSFVILVPCAGKCDDKSLRIPAAEFYSANDIEAMVRYACSRLVGKECICPVQALFLFCAGYAALNIIEKGPRFYFESPSKDVKSSLERLTETAYAVITRLQMLSNHMPLVKVLSTCLIMFYNRLHPRSKTSKVMTITEKMLEELSIYHDFTFGMLYLHKEVSSLFSTDPIFKEKDRSTPVENLSRTSSFDSQILPNTISIARQKLARMATSDTDDLF